MSLVVILLSGVVGLFIAAAVWNVARNQVNKAPLFSTPSCDTGSGQLSILSWLPLYGIGSARGCPADGSRQSSRRILFELAVAAYFAFAAWQIDGRVELLAVALFTVPLLVILLVDAWTRLIHSNIVLFGIILGWLFAAVDGIRQLGSSVVALAAAALVFAGLFFLAIVVYRNPKVVPFGLGDVYLAAMIGAMVRLDDIARALLYGIFLAGVSLAVLLALKLVNRRQPVPYGPFLVLGALIVLVY